MIDIGINYITELNDPFNRYDDIYELLMRNGYINTIKFPGKYCNNETLKFANLLSKRLNLKLDIHGLPGMIPSVYSNKLLENIDWENLRKVLGDNINRISTHMGLENKDRISNYTNIELENNWNTNVNTLKIKMKEICKKNIKFGIENIPGGFDYDIETLTPKFISYNWSKADFGIFDISHAKLASSSLKLLYSEYLEEIKYKEKVKILHLSGNIDETNEFDYKPDKHVLINKYEIRDIINALKAFPNIDLIVSEYGYCTKYSYEKELIIEAITIYSIAKTMNEDLTKEILEFLQANLKDDISNIDEIINNKKIKLLK